MTDLSYRAFNSKFLDNIGVENTKPIDAIPTPFPSWNKVCGEEGGRVGVAKGWMVVLAGTPGTGKSTLALNIAAHAVHAGKKVGDINFEMSSSQLASRYLAILTGTEKFRLERGQWYDQGAWLKATAEADRIQEETGGVFVSNKEALFTLDDIEKSYQVLADRGVEMIVIDYAQLIQVKGVDGIFQRTEAVANMLRHLTKKHNVVTLALAQFNRETSKARDSPPSREGLSGGAAWENNANQILMLDHSVRRYFPETKTELTQLLCDKNRHGLVPWRLPIKWDWATSRCEEHQGVDAVDIETSEPEIQEGGAAYSTAELFE